MAIAGAVRAGAAYVEVFLDNRALVQGLAVAQYKLQRFSATLQSLGTKMMATSAAMFAPVAGGVTVFTQFETGMANVNTMLRDSDKYMEQYKTQIREMAMSVGSDMESMTTGLYDVLSASIDPSKAMGVLGASSKMAVAGLTDVATATNGLTTMLNAYNLEAEDATKVTDWFFTTMTRAKATIPELAETVGMVASTANSAGMSMKELGATIAMVSRHGVPIHSAIASINQVLMAFLKPSQEAVTMMEKLKETDPDIAFDLTPETLALEGFVGVTNKLLKLQSADIAKIFRNARGVRAVMTIMTDKSTLGNEMSFFENMDGATAVAFEKVASTLGFALSKLKAKFIDLGITIGAALADPIRKAITFMEKYYDVVSKYLKMNPKVVQGFVKIAAALGSLGAMMLAAGVAVQPLVLALSAAGLSLSVMIPVLSTMAAGLAGLMSVSVALGTSMSATFTSIPKLVRKASRAVASFFRGVPVESIEDMISVTSGSPGFDKKQLPYGGSMALDVFRSSTQKKRKPITIDAVVEYSKIKKTTNVSPFNKAIKGVTAGTMGFVSTLKAMATSVGATIQKIIARVSKAGGSMMEIFGAMAKTAGGLGARITATFGTSAVAAIGSFAAELLVAAAVVYAIGKAIDIVVAQVIEAMKVMARSIYAGFSGIAKAIGTTMAQAFETFSGSYDDIVKAIRSGDFETAFSMVAIAVELAMEDAFYNMSQAFMKFKYEVLKGMDEIAQKLPSISNIVHEVNKVNPAMAPLRTIDWLTGSDSLGAVEEFAGVTGSGFGSKEAEAQARKIAYGNEAHLKARKALLEKQSAIREKIAGVYETSGVALDDEIVSLKEKLKLQQEITNSLLNQKGYSEALANERKTEMLIANKSGDSAANKRIKEIYEEIVAIDRLIDKRKEELARDPNKGVAANMYLDSKLLSYVDQKKALRESMRFGPEAAGKKDLKPYSVALPPLPKSMMEWASSFKKMQKSEAYARGANAVRDAGSAIDGLDPIAKDIGGAALKNLGRIGLGMFGIPTSGESIEAMSVQTQTMAAVTTKSTSDPEALDTLMGPLESPIESIKKNTKDTKDILKEIRDSEGGTFK